MPVLIAVLVFLAVLFIFRRPGTQRRCRWKSDPRTRNNTLQRYICMECSVDAYSSDGKPPMDCKRHLRDTRS